MQIGDEAIEVFPLEGLIRREAGAIEGSKPVVMVRTSTGASAMQSTNCSVGKKSSSSRWEH